jgi:hypothetical protein
MTSSIANIEIDHFGCIADRVATKNIGRCICFITILNDGKVFVEHRSDIFFPSEITSDNVALWIENLAEHIVQAAPGSNIT